MCVPTGPIGTMYNSQQAAICYQMPTSPIAMSNANVSNYNLYQLLKIFIIFILFLLKSQQGP